MVPPPFPPNPTGARAVVFTLSRIHGGAALGFHAEAVRDIFSGYEATRGKVSEPPSEFWHWCN